MSGHSKWSSIKHKKAVTDSRRGKLFSKLIKEITVAARMGGGDPTANPRLRQVVDTAKGQNMPNDNITRAIKKGTGEIEGEVYEETIYEGYGPGGVAVLVKCLTENRNRSASSVKAIFNKNAGKPGEKGCVAWMFEEKGMLTFNQSEADEETLMELAMEAGAEDFEADGDQFTLYVSPSQFEELKGRVEAEGLAYELAEVTMRPQSTVQLGGRQAEQMIRLMERLEEDDDVQNVWANFDIPDEVMEQLTVEAE